MTRRDLLRILAAAAVCAPSLAVPSPPPPAGAANPPELLPRHITPQAQKAIKNGLEYIAKQQGQDGNYPNSQDGQEYPTVMTALAGMAFLANGNTPSRGPYADGVRKCERYLMGNAQASG